MRSSDVVARLTASKDTQWSTSVLQHGAHLHKSQRIELSGGYVDITFDSGARVVLEGAASLDINSAWDATLRKYRLRFDPAVNLVRTGNDEADIVTNTQVFTKITEDYVRRYPEQWLWVHRRWKTRPPGEPGLY